MSDVRKTRVLNDKNSSQRMQNQHSHQANQTTHFEQSERANDIFSQDVKARTDNYGIGERRSRRTDHHRKHYNDNNACRIGA